MSPIENEGVENVNLTSVVPGHQDYINKMDEVLKILGMYKEIDSIEEVRQEDQQFAASAENS